MANDSSSTRIGGGRTNLGSKPHSNSMHIADTESMEIYDLELETLRSMVGKEAGKRYLGRQRRKRRLVQRALDLKELIKPSSSSVLIRECVPYIKSKEKELEETKGIAQMLLTRMERLEREVSSLKETERRSIVILDNEQGKEPVGLIREELHPNQIETIARLLGIRVKDVRRLSYLISQALGEGEVQARAAFELVFRSRLGENGSYPMTATTNIHSSSRSNQQEGEQPQRLSPAAFHQIRQALRTLSLQCPWLAATSNALEITLPSSPKRRSPSSSIPSSSSSDSFAYEALINRLARAAVLQWVCSGMGATSPSFRDREERRANVLQLSPVRHRPASNNRSILPERSLILSRGPSRSSERHHQPQQDRSLSPADLTRATTPEKKRVDGLRSDFSAAGKALEDTVRRLQKDMEWVAASSTIRSASSRARLLAIRLGLERLDAFAARRKQQSLLHALRQWDACVEYQKNEILSHRFQRLKSAYHVSDILSRLREKRLNNALRALWLNMIQYRDQERAISTLTIQKVVRGGLARRRYTRERRRLAATRIQCLVRGMILRHKVNRRKTQIMAKRQRIFRRQHITRHAAIAIQRITRGYLTRKRIYSYRQDTCEEKAVLRIQCFLRMAYARMQRSELRHLRTWNAAATKIQGIARAFDAKKRMKRLKTEHNEAMERKALAAVLALEQNSQRKDDEARRLKEEAKVKEEARVKAFRESQQKALAAGSAGGGGGGSQSARRGSKTSKDKSHKHGRTKRSLKEESNSNALVIPTSSPSSAIMDGGEDDWGLAISSPTAVEAEVEFVPKPRRHTLASPISIHPVSLSLKMTPPSPVRRGSAADASPLFQPLGMAGSPPKIDKTVLKRPKRKKITFATAAMCLMLAQRYLRGWKQRHSIVQAERREQAEQMANQIKSGDIQHGMPAGQFLSDLRRSLQGDQETYRVLRQEYFKKLETSFGHQAIKLQTFARVVHSTKQLKRKKQEREDRLRKEANDAAVVIQARVRQWQAVKRVEQLLQDAEDQEAATVIQCLVRQFLACRLVHRLQSQRQAQEELERRKSRACSLVQRLYRGHRVRFLLWHELQQIKRRLALSHLSDKDQAAIVIQCAYRSYRAYWECMRRLRGYYARRAKEEAEKRLQEEIARAHKQLQRDAKIIIIQCAIRCFIAWRRVKRRRLERHHQLLFLKEHQKGGMAQRIQSYFRGFRTRKWLFRNFSRLVSEREDRKYCVECSGRMPDQATRLCRTCRDRYCDSCWQIFHAHGNKRTHTYKSLEHDRYDVVPSFNVTTQRHPNSDWVEHWDDSVQATYYYNRRTGEASWVYPEELGSSEGSGASNANTIAFLSQSGGLQDSTYNQYIRYM